MVTDKQKAEARKKIIAKASKKIKKLQKQVDNCNKKLAKNKKAKATKKKAAPKKKAVAKPKPPPVKKVAPKKKAAPKKKVKVPKAVKTAKRAKKDLSKAKARASAPAQQKLKETIRRRAGARTTATRGDFSIGPVRRFTKFRIAGSQAIGRKKVDLDKDFDLMIRKGKDRARVFFEAPVTKKVEKEKTGAYKYFGDPKMGLNPNTLYFQNRINQFQIPIRTEAEKEGFKNRLLGGIVDSRPDFTEVDGNMIFTGRKQVQFNAYARNLKRATAGETVYVRDRIPAFKAEKLFRATKFGEYRTSLKQKRKSKAKQYAKRNKKFGFM